MPQLHLPPAMAELRDELGTVVAGIEAKAPYGAALLSANQGLTIRVEDKEETVTEIPPTAGTVLTAFDGLTVQENAISGFNKDEVRRGAQSLINNIGLSPGNSSAPVDPGPTRQGDFASENVTGLFSIQDTLERVRALHHRLRGRDPRLVNVRVRYAEFAETSVFRNRTADLAQEVIRQVMTLMIFASGSNGVRFNLTQKGTTKGWDELAFSDEELQRLIDITLALNDAERIEPGEYTVITSPGVSGVLCHESFGHGVETDMFLKERALAAHYLDRTVGSSLVNIFDDPSVSGAFGSYFFDAEGVLSKPTQIVENGTFRRGITDMYSAHALNLQRTANGRRQDYSRKAYARMSNTFFAPGTTAVSNLFAQVDNGVYLEQWSSGMEDPQGWGIQVTCHYGHEIKNGKVTGRMFAPIGISGYVPDVLQGVSAVGNDWALDPGGCGKGHKEAIRVTSGGPHLLLKARLG